MVEAGASPESGERKRRLIGFHGVSDDVEAIQATRKDVRSLPSLLVHCAVECRPSDAPLVARTEAAATRTVTASGRRGEERREEADDGDGG